MGLRVKLLLRLRPFLFDLLDSVLAPRLDYYAERHSHRYKSLCYRIPVRKVKTAVGIACGFEIECP